MGRGAEKRGRKLPLQKKGREGESRLQRRQHLLASEEVREGEIGNGRGLWLNGIGYSGDRSGQQITILSLRLVSFTFYFMRMNNLPTCMSVPCAGNAYGGQRRTSYPLELEL